MTTLHTLIPVLLCSVDALDLTSVELLDALVFYITDAVPNWLRRVRASSFVREIVSEFMLTDTDGGRHAP
jgi:hypothetical protein